MSMIEQQPLPLALPSEKIKPRQSGADQSRQRSAGSGAPGSGVVETSIAQKMPRDIARGKGKGDACLDEPSIAHVRCGSDRCPHRYNCKRYSRRKLKKMKEFNYNMDDCLVPVWEADDD